MRQHHQQQVLDALDVCKQRIQSEEDRNERNARALRVGKRIDREYDQDGIAKDKAFINVASLESYMPICNHLAIGHRFANKRDVEVYVPGRNIRYIVNLRDNDGDKGMWYVKHAKSLGVLDVHHVVLETTDDKDRSRPDDQTILSVASKVVEFMAMAKQMHETKPHMHHKLPTVFIHGYSAPHTAAVVALVAWYLHQDDNRFDPLKALAERYDDAIADSCPEHWFHREQVTRICANERKSVYAAFKRGKVDVTRETRRSTPMIQSTPSRDIRGMFVKSTPGSNTE